MFKVCLNNEKNIKIKEIFLRISESLCEVIMRLRNIPRADEYIDAHEKSISEVDMKQLRGLWGSEFKNIQPIHIEIGMGKGQFILNLAKQNPHINYIGIERYSSVLLRAIEKYDTEEFCHINNIRFICMDANEIGQVFAQEEVGKIYLNFSDPWPKARHAKRRLPSKEFLSKYDAVLHRDGVVEFKTDNVALFEFALEEVELTKWELLAHTFDLHNDEDMMQGNVMTEYEMKFSEKGNAIHKMVIKR